MQVPHEVLNAEAERAGRESEIVAQAGRAFAITIATNMAGRGTDILLGGTPLHMCPRTTVYYCICVLMLLCMCPHTSTCVASYYCVCVLNTTLCVSSYYYVCVLLLLCMCRHAAIRVLILLYAYCS